MTAIRLARGATGRDLLVKFDGHYHGHSDALLVAAGSGLATLAMPGSSGIPDAIARQALACLTQEMRDVVIPFIAQRPIPLIR